jgi:hypothetical protein
MLVVQSGNVNTTELAVKTGFTFLNVNKNVLGEYETSSFPEVDTVGVKLIVCAVYPDIVFPVIGVADLITPALVIVMNVLISEVDAGFLNPPMLIVISMEGDDMVPMVIVI